MPKKSYLLVAMIVILTATAQAQDFGFGFDDDAAVTASSPALSVKIGGELAAELTGYVHDFSSGEKTKAASLGDIVSGALNFSASGSNVDAFIALNLSAANFRDIASGWGDPVFTPLFLDEAYLRAYFGPVSVEAGLRKLTWGKADSLGPLDVTNPLDYSDLTNISDIHAIKIARPMVHAAWNTGDFSKLEAVFIPNFTGHRFAQNGRWAPAQFSSMAALAANEIYDRVLQGIYPYISASPFAAMIMMGLAPGIQGIMDSQLASGFSPDFPDTSGLEYFQGGLRFTTTVGSADIGAQYFFGNLFQPDVSIAGIDAFVADLVSTNEPLLSSIPGLSFLDLMALLDNPPDFYSGNINLLSPQIKYNRYHQIGVDYAQVLFGFNLRGEFAVHLTEDFKGDDGSVLNPFLAWSLGFDRDLIWGINANIQCNETIRLLNDKVGNDPLLDCEAGTDATSTRITMHFSKKFLRDNLESKASVIWDIENSDCYIIPGLAWTIKDLTAELSAGVFAGKDSGDLGQYWENSFVRLGMKYSF